MRVPLFCARTKSFAAFSAAVSRLGTTSVEHIDPDTSTASRIAEESDGTTTVACGRAAPPASTTRPAASNHSGIRRRHADRCGSAARTSATLDIRTAPRRRRRRSHHRYPSSSGKASSASSAQGQVSDIYRIRPYQVTMSSPPAVSSSTATTTAAPVSSMNSGFAVIRRATDR